MQYSIKYFYIPMEVVQKSAVLIRMPEAHFSQIADAIDQTSECQRSIDDEV
jgi:hypothetical protein